ncbi:MAG TPA: T9SS type A sorting domain-containing protein, partial [Candidatus Cloacimonetes bacterium]|nr:T9SS type A sorting domain-containing protein [Candidatus Cloacimonadota bacterium]
TSGRLDSLTTKTDEDFDLPEFFISNYPNPFNPEVNISFSLPERSFVKLSIYNLKGQLVKTLINEKYENGNFNIKWNGRNKQNEPVASGVYFYKFESEKFSKIKKILLFR